MLTTWSYSALSTYQQCPKKYDFAYVQKLPQEYAPAAERGKAMHADAEAYLRGTQQELAPSLGRFRRLFEDLRSMSATAEHVVTVDRNWDPAGERWLKAIMDATLIYPDGTADVVDYKSGRPYPGHAQQMMLYGTTLIAAYPQVTHVTTRLWYLDSGAETKGEVTAQAAEASRRIFTKMADTMLADEDLRPTPGAHCRWCPFKTQCPASKA